MERIDQEALGEIIRRIVEVARPEKIILFGSAARGEMGPNKEKLSMPPDPLDPALGGRFPPDDPREAQEIIT